MLSGKKSSKGFTIVELLIVIVIIGILAALVIVAFNGIQNRANNTQTITAVATYAKALRAYATDNGGWPATVTAYPCMGEHSGTCAQQSTTTPSCASGTLHCAVSPNSTMNNAMRPYYNGGTVTPPSLQLVTITVPSFGNVDYRGAVVWGSSVSAASVQIRYYLKGSNTNCGSPAGFTATQDAGFSGDTSCRVLIQSPL